MGGLQATANGQGAAELRDLSDDILVRVFGKLSLKLRHTTLPPVCRRWWRLANSRQLLADLDVSLALHGDDYAAFLQRVRRLCEWVLLRAAGHVQRLQLHLAATCKELQAAEEVHTALVAMLVGCAAAEGGLQHLRLRLEIPSTAFWLSSWVPALRSVQRLEVSTQLPVAPLLSRRSVSRLMAAAHMRSLSSLQQLVLEGAPLVFRDDLQLPTALTSLSVSGFRARRNALHEVALMDKVLAATALRRLRIRDADPADLRQLSRLTGLQQLALSPGRGLVGSSLPLPPSLEELYLSDLPNASWLPASLAQAAQLSCLVLDGVETQVVPSLLAESTSLRCLGWRPPSSSSAHTSPLPSGPWLSSLMELAAPLHATASRLRSIGPQLRTLCLLGLGSATREEQLAVLRWAAQQPGLQRLSLDCHSALLHADVAFALLHLSRARPGLQIEPGRGLMDSLRAQAP